MAFAIENLIGTGTDQELLDLTRAAIAKVTAHGQAYSIDGRSLTRADLKALHEQEQYYEIRVNAALGTSRDKQNIARLRRAV